MLDREELRQLDTFAWNSTAGQFEAVLDEFDLLVFEVGTPELTSWQWQVCHPDATDDEVICEGTLPAVDKAFIQARVEAQSLIHEAEANSRYRLDDLESLRRAEARGEL
jgi:hypothetical protein